MNSREFILDTVVSQHPDAIFITSTGYISRAMYDLYPDNNNIFYMQGSMGLAPCIGLGMAANSDKEIVVISGDAALLMHLGITHTIAEQELKNLFIYVLDNGCHESVGEFECAGLGENLIGITRIFKITNDGKTDRVDLDCQKNTKQIKELF
jgi:phosphonopyruvate decarboxylase